VELLVTPRVLPYASLGLFALLALPALADEAGTFHPFVSYTRYYDSNLFRLADDESTVLVEDDVPVVVTRDSASDQYGILSAGLNVDWTPGRQRILASAAKNWVRFSRYSSLDYDGSDYRLRWNWQLGNRWSGNIGASETLTQTSFADWYAGEIASNELTYRTQFAGAEWQFHPRWHVGLSGSATTATNSTAIRTPLDYEQGSVAATAGYTTPKGSRLLLQVNRIDGEYPNRPLAYTQTEYNFLGDWKVDGKVTAHAKIGYIQRDNETFAGDDFSGVGGRVSADYLISGKSMLSWAIYRETMPSDDVFASYQLRTGTSLAAIWATTPKFSVRSSASYENRSFRGDAGVALFTRRDEDTVSGSLSLGYTPRRWATAELGVQAGRRDADFAFNDYSFRSVFASLRTEF
jgi:exopolysaccharide biosynthesis operon protein EpsL